MTYLLSCPILVSYFIYVCIDVHFSMLQRPLRDGLMATYYFCLACVDFIADFVLVLYDV